MANTTIQPSFTAGELSPSLYGRVDLNRYYTGLKTCQNFIVRPYGGVANRPGTQFIAEVKDSTKAVRLIPFQFSVVQAYVLEFGEEYMRVYKDGIYQTEIATPWLETEIFDLSYTQSADVLIVCHPNFPPQQISRTGHTTWTIAEFTNQFGPFKEINTDTNHSFLCSDVEGTITVTANWDIFTVDHVGDILYLEQLPNDHTPAWEVSKRIYIGDIVVAGNNYYKSISADPSGGEPRITGTLKPTVTDGTESDGMGLLEGNIYRPPAASANVDAYVGVEWGYLHSGHGIVRIDSVTDARHATCTVLKRLPEWVCDVAGGTPLTVTAVTANPDGFARCTITGHGLTTGQELLVSLDWVGLWVEIIDGEPPTSIDHYQTFTKTDTVTCYVVDSDTVDVFMTWPPDSEVSGGHTYSFDSFDTGTVTATAITGSATYKWAFGAWSVLEGYPYTAIYHQQRLWFGGTPSQPQTVWASAIGAYDNFYQSIPVLDDEAITFTIASNQVNSAKSFAALSELIFLTTGGEWVIKGDNSGIMSPATINVRAQGFSGSSRLAPIIVGHTALHCQSKGSQVRALAYSFQDDSFIGADLTVLSSHLFFGKTLSDWAYQTIPFGVAWCVRDDGSLLGLTYLREQDVAGWHVHTTDGLFESVCVISEGNEDAVYVLVNRDGNRYIERLHTRYFADVRDAYFVDSGLSYDGRNTTAKTMTVSGGTAWDHTETLTITASGSTFVAGDVGNQIVFVDETNWIYYRLTITAYTSATVVQGQLNRTLPASYRNTARTDWALAKDEFTIAHLNGKTVSILADGNVGAQQTVTANKVTLPTPASVVHIGLPYECDFETLNLASNSQIITDKFKLINRVNVSVESSRGLFAGPDFDNLLEYKQRAGENYDQPILPETGLFLVQVIGRWDTNGRVAIRQSDPLPLTILAVIPEVAYGG